MANLTLTDLKKHAEKDGGARLNAFLDKFLTSKLNPTAKFLMMDGKKFLPTLIYTTETSRKKEWFYHKNVLRTKADKTKFKKDVLSGKITSIWLANDNDLIPLSQLQKTKEFGGAEGAGGPESLAIRAETLITEGTQTKIPYGGRDAEVACFNDAASIKKSILVGMKKNRNVSKNIIKSFTEWGEDGNWNEIKWIGNIPNNEMNQLGKYVGEVITGIMGFTHRRSLSWRGFDPLVGGIKQFCVPTDPAFTGVDVFFVMNDESIISISNKYGKGAAASFFANLLPYVMISRSVVPEGALLDIVNIAKIKSSAEQMKGRGAPSKQILYEYGFKHILGSATENLNNKTKINDIRDPYSVYTSIKKNKSTDDVDTVVNAVIQYLGKHKNLESAEIIKRELPNSLTSFFARVTAERLNQPQPIKFMIKILKGKNYWQANLNQKDWKKGKISYSIFSSKSVELEIIGSKGVIKDIEMGEGMLNFHMTPKPGDPIITIDDPTL